MHNTYFVHDTCEESIYLDLSGIVKIISQFGLDRTGLTVGLAKFSDNQERGTSVFFCENCSEVVDINHIRALCMDCGQYFPIKDIYTLRDSGGIYCPEHSVKDNDPRTKIVELIGQVRFTG